MPNTTTNYQLPYPSSTDPANISQDIGNLAIQTDSELYNVYSSLATNYRYVQNNTSAVDKDFIVCDSISAITISLPTSPTNGTAIKVFNQGTANVTISTSLTINGSTTVTSSNGVTIVYLNSEWWCLPLSSSQSTTKGWTRPTDWITIPTLVDGESVVYAILPVYSGLPNFCWLVAENAYTVDWGDGTAVQSFASGVAAYHEYDWADIDLNTLTSDGFYQVLIEVRPQVGSSLTTFAGTNDVSFLETNNKTTVYTRFIEIQATSPDFVRIPAAIPSWNLSPIALTLKYDNNITDTYINSWSYTNGYAQDMEYLYLELPQCTYLSPNYFDECKIKEAHFVIPNVTSINDFIWDCPNLTKLTFETSSLLTSFWAGYAVRRDCELIITNTTNITNWQYFASLELNYEDSGVWTRFDGIDFSSGTDFNRFYAWCYSETSLPAASISSATNVDSLFTGNYHLIETPSLNLPNVTSAVNMFWECTSLRRSNITGLKCTHSYEDCKLVAAELNNVYTNLGTALSGAIITVTGNPGVTGDDPTIAEAKGWTVIG